MQPITDLAASWYIAVESKALGKKPKPIDLFGEPLVAWRDKEGHPIVMKRYCSHMGANLATGQVIDGELQCPFHHWRYDKIGQCISIPDVENIPPAACQKTYVTVERYGFIWAWYGSKIPQFSLPEFIASEDKPQDYMPASHFTWSINTRIRRLLENSYDYSHFAPVHGLRNIKGPSQCALLNNQEPQQKNKLFISDHAWFGVSIETHFKTDYDIVSRAITRILDLYFETTTIVVNGWPSGNVTTIVFQGKEKLKIMVASTPVSNLQTIVHVLVKVKKTGQFWLDMIYRIMFDWQTRTSGTEDAFIWNNMNIDKGGTYVKHDQLVLKFREFYQKWVNNVESIDIS